MAYNESTIGGTWGSRFRVFVRTNLHMRGDANQNYEHWNAEGGVRRAESIGGTIWSNGASYTLQLGLNGVASSGGFSYNYNTNVEQKNIWSTVGTNAYRNAAGQGYGFTARMDVNLNNSPGGLTSGWVTVGDNVATVYRQATLTNLSQDITDMDNPWIEFSNPGGLGVYAWLELPNLTGTTRYFQQGPGLGSRHTWYLTEADRNQLRTVLVGVNSTTVRYVLETAVAGNPKDTRDRTYTIINAEPIFTNFTFLDTNGATVAVTGSNQVLIQGKSTLRATVPVANKAIAIKSSTMTNYSFSLGGYSESSPWSNTVDVVKEIGIINDVFGAKDISVRAIDSRGNNKTVTKPVTILPYSSPGFYNGLSVKYTNDFDASTGLKVEAFEVVGVDKIIAVVSPMTLLGVDKNSVLVAGLSYDIRKGDSPYTGTYTNIPFTQEAGTGNIKTNPVTLATSIRNRMGTLIDNNEVRWYVKFRIIDKLETAEYIVAIDVGTPFFRIGANGRLYYKELEFFSTFSGFHDQWIPGLTARLGPGTWLRSTVPSCPSANGVLYSQPANLGDLLQYIIYLPPGEYVFQTYFRKMTTGAIVNMSINGFNLGNFDTYDASTTGVELSNTTGIIIVGNGTTYYMNYQVVGRNALNTTNYQMQILGLQVRRTGDVL